MTDFGAVDVAVRRYRMDVAGRNVGDKAIEAKAEYSCGGEVFWANVIVRPLRLGIGLMHWRQVVGNPSSVPTKARPIE